MSTRTLTVGQAVIAFLRAQFTERDGERRPLFAGCFGIFGHGNVAGIGEALGAQRDFRFIPARNEQGMVHAAAGYARMTNRLQTWACTTSIGPGATNMLTAAAGATINRLPVLLLPGEVFATRAPDPVLQQLESQGAGDVSVNDAFRVVSRFFDRVWRPEQLPSALLQAMRVLTDPAETGAVTLCLPQDVQAEAFDYPNELFEERVWHVGRPAPEAGALRRAAETIRSARRPLIVAGGGVIYAEATTAVRALAERSGIPVAETQAGRGALPSGHDSALGAVGVTGTRGANAVAARADVVIGIGTRYSDFTSASHSAFAHREVRFVNLNISAFDAGKFAGIAVLADARAGIEALEGALSGHTVDEGYRREVAEHVRAWDDEVGRIYDLGHGPPVSQGEVIGAVNAAAQERDVVVCAAGSMPGDLHKLWRARDPKGYHVEYGYSCMGYEIPGGIGVKLAAPDREVFVMIGDGSYLMLPGELVTALQERVKLIIVLVQNHGFASIRGLSRSVGAGGFGTDLKGRGESGLLDGKQLDVDLAANAASLGARVARVSSVDELRAALADARAADETTVVHVETDPEVSVPSYDSWWDVPVAEVSESDEVRAARADYLIEREQGRPFVTPSD